MWILVSGLSGDIGIFAVHARSFYFFNACVYSYKLPSLYRFCWIPYILVCCVFVFICLHVFSEFSYDFLFDPLVVTECVNFHIFFNALAFLLLLISSLIPLWSEKIFHIVSTFYTLLGPLLWHDVSSFWENVPHTLEKNVYSAIVRLGPTTTC